MTRESNGGVRSLFSRPPTLLTLTEWWMAALLKRKKNIEKRRNRTLSSWESNTSPEAKKPRSGIVNVKEEDETHETDDEFRKL